MSLKIFIFNKTSNVFLYYSYLFTNSELVGLNIGLNFLDVIEPVVDV